MRPLFSLLERFHAAWLSSIWVALVLIRPCPVSSQIAAIVITVGSRSSPGPAVGSSTGTEVPRDREGPDELREDLFFVCDDFVPTSAESLALVDFRTRFFRGGAEECERLTSGETSTGPLSPDC